MENPKAVFAYVFQFAVSSTATGVCLGEAIGDASCCAIGFVLTASLPFLL